MGTRSIITFMSRIDTPVELPYRYGDPTEPRLEGISIYKHWDGHTETTVPELQEFLKWNGNRNDDLEYTVANYVYWYKNKHQRQQEADGHGDLGTNGCGHTGLGITVKKFFLGDTKQICKEAYESHGAEYVYVVDLDDKKIRELTGLEEWGFEEKWLNAHFLHPNV